MPFLSRVILLGVSLLYEPRLNDESRFVSAILEESQHGTYRLAAKAAFSQQSQQFELVGGHRGNTLRAHIPLPFEPEMTIQWR